MVRRRTEIPIVRSPDPQLIDKSTLTCQSLILVGDLSPFVDDAVEVNSRLNPKKTTFLKVSLLGSVVVFVPCDVCSRGGGQQDQNVTSGGQKTFLEGRLLFLLCLKQAV